MEECKYYNSKFYRTCMKIAMHKLEKNYLDEKSKAYLSEKGNYEYAIRCFCRYLAAGNYNLDTYIIYGVPDYVVTEFLKEQIEKIDLSDIKKCVLIGKMATILNDILTKDINIMELWPRRDVKCDCGTMCHLIEAKWAYSQQAVINSNLQGRYYYRCPVCGAMVGTHIGTNIPYGTPVNKETAEMRVKTHSLMEEMISKNNLEKTDVYHYLVSKFPTKSVEKVHVGCFDTDSCKKAMNFLLNVNKPLAI